jgi:hypothetical protein
MFSEAFHGVFDSLVDGGSFHDGYFMKLWQKRSDNFYILKLAHNLQIKKFFGHIGELKQDGREIIQ